METNNSDRLDRSVLEVILQSEWGEHHSILYNDATNLSYFYSNYSKIALESLNELILILSHSQPIDYVFNNLTNNGIDVQKWKRDGSLVVIESKKGFYGLTDKFVGIIIMIKMLLQRVHKLGKDGLTVISDMSIFFSLNRILDLIKHEKEFLSSISNMKVKALCFYSIFDFEKLEEPSKQQLFKYHNKVILI